MPGLVKKSASGVAKNSQVAIHGLGSSTVGIAKDGSGGGDENSYFTQKALIALYIVCGAATWISPSAVPHVQSMSRHGTNVGEKKGRIREPFEFNKLKKSHFPN